MSISPYRIVLSGGFGSVTIASDRQAAEASSGLRVDWDSGGVAGWDSAPDAKVSSTERQAGDGAHDVSESDIEYESRVVTVNIAAFGETRDEVLAAMRRLQAAHKQLVTMRVVDASSDTYCERGYVVVKWDEEWHEQTATGTLTAIFVRPYRLSTLPSEGMMVPATSDGGGLVFDDTSNLTPFFSRSFSDATYWTSIDTKHITQLTDGWAHVACDNSSGTETSFSSCSPNPLSALTAETRYTILAEVRNNTSAKLSADSFVKILQNESTGVINQLVTQNEIHDAIANGSQRFSVTTKSDMSDLVVTEKRCDPLAIASCISFCVTSWLITPVDSFCNIFTKLSAESLADVLLRTSARMVYLVSAVSAESGFGEQLEKDVSVPDELSQATCAHPSVSCVMCFVSILVQ